MDTFVLRSLRQVSLESRHVCGLQLREVARSGHPERVGSLCREWMRHSAFEPNSWVVNASQGQCLHSASVCKNT